MAERRFTRKQVLVAGGVGAAAVGGGAAAVVIATRGEGEGEDYPRFAVAKVGDLQPNKPVSFEYPVGCIKSAGRPICPLQEHCGSQDRGTSSANAAFNSCP